VFSNSSTSLPLSYVESTAPTHFRPDLFERDPKVGVALEAHYGPAHLGVPNFAVQLATLVSERAAALGKSRDRVLDIGCVSPCGLVHPSMYVLHVIPVPFRARPRRLLTLRAFVSFGCRLVISCGAGRTTFELARHCAYVLGLDLSTRFFRLAVELKDRGAVYVFDLLVCTSTHALCEILSGHLGLYSLCRALK
jgi:SAM-dependent methyltransferase